MKNKFILGLILGLLTTITFAQDKLLERSLSKPTGHWYFTSISENGLNTFTKRNNARIIDIEKRPNSKNYSVSLVKNSGQYKVNGWWWYQGTFQFIKNKVKKHRARIIDLETFKNSRGQRRYIAVMVKTAPKGWWWYAGLTANQLRQKYKAHKARIVDIESYKTSQGRRYLAVMIRNSGADKKGWWYYRNASFQFLRDKLSRNKARILDLDRMDNGKFNVVMVRRDGTKTWWNTNRTREQLSNLLSQTKSRVIDIEPHLRNGKLRFMVVSIDNANKLEKRVRNFFSPLAPGARRGFYLRNLNGGTLANVRGGDNFIPASSMKVLYHYTALRRVSQNQLNLNSQNRNLCGADTTNSPGNAPSIPGTNSCPFSNNFCESNLVTNMRLRILLGRMMIQSNNRATQSVRELVTQFRINQNAGLLGMTKTTVRERIGCGVHVCLDNQNRERPCPGNQNDAPVDFGYRGVPINGNEVTLADYSKIYKGVIDGSLGNQTDNFRDLMLSDANNPGGWVWSVATQENATVGLSPSELNSFRNNLRFSWKGGSYSNGVANTIHFSQSGMVSIPRVQGTNIVVRDYAFGAFQDNGPSGQANQITAVTSELIRDLMRKAMTTFKN